MASLHPDSRSSRYRDKSRTRSRDTRSRSRSDAGPRRAPSPPSARQSRSPRDIPPVQELRGRSESTSIDMPAMPAMPGAFEDDVSTMSSRSATFPAGFPPAPGVKHAATFPLAGGGVPYPTSSFFPDPDYYDITGGGTKPSIDDSLAFGSTPYPDEDILPPLPRQQYGMPRHDSISDYQQPDAGMPSAPAFYGITANSSETRSLPSRKKGHDRGGSVSTSSTKPSSSSILSPASRQEGFVDFTPDSTSRGRASSLLSPAMDRLSVSGGHKRSSSTSGGLPPPSPLLEAYTGTYQSMTPMVAAMKLESESDISDLESLNTDSRYRDFKPDKETSGSKSKSSKSSSSKSKSKSSSDKSHHAKDKDREKRREKDRDYASENERTIAKAERRVKLYDAATEAEALSKALSHSHSSNIDYDTITNILPELTHDQTLSLRSEYKKIAKVNGKGINLAKHLKLKLSGNYGKAAHVTALGRWESESYWANFFYQSASSRRELLIESLMGRSNAEIRAIKDDFRDKRYGDDLGKMIERELRADKFRTAVGWVLEERRQEETDVYPPEILRRDVQVLAQSLGRKEGGETAMLEIVVRRSDAHLREVLRVFEAETRVNFAREALKRSGNLVGEVLAHILNGVINRPARDALLLRHAIKDIASRNKDEELRYELLISRLIRLHWDQAHLQKVKREYRATTGKELERDIADATKGDFRAFMVELCDPRS